MAVECNVFSRLFWISARAGLPLGLSYLVQPCLLGAFFSSVPSVRAEGVSVPVRPSYPEAPLVCGQSPCWPWRRLVGIRGWRFCCVARSPLGANVIPLIGQCGCCPRCLCGSLSMPLRWADFCGASCPVVPPTPLTLGVLRERVGWPYEVPPWSP